MLYRLQHIIQVHGTSDLALALTLHALWMFYYCLSLYLYTYFLFYSDFSDH